jgi:elongator complex protein 2
MVRGRDKSDACVFSQFPTWLLSTLPEVTFKHHQTLQIAGRLPLDCQIAQLPGVSSKRADTEDRHTDRLVDCILAVASTERVLRIYIDSDGQVRASRPNLSSCLTSRQFIPALTLSGHEDWIRALAFSAFDSSQTLSLASGSQDGTIRIWSITPAESATVAPLGNSDFSTELLDAFEASLGHMADEEGGRQISANRHVIAVKEGERSASQKPEGASALRSFVVFVNSK